GRSGLAEIAKDVLIAPVFEGDDPRDSDGAPGLAALDHLTGGAVSSIFDEGEMTGKRDEWVLLRNVGPFSTKRLLFYGAGRRENISPLAMGGLGGGAIRTLAKHRAVRSAAFLITNRIESGVQAIVEGVLIGNMNVELYKANGDNAGIESLELISDVPAPP